MKFLLTVGLVFLGATALTLLDDWHHILVFFIACGMWGWLVGDVGEYIWRKTHPPAKLFDIDIAGHEDTNVLGPQIYSDAWDRYMKVESDKNDIYLL